VTNIEVCIASAVVDSSILVMHNHLGIFRAFGICDRNYLIWGDIVAFLGRGEMLTYDGLMLIGVDFREQSGHELPIIEKRL